MKIKKYLILPNWSQISLEKYVSKQQKLVFRQILVTFFLPGYKIIV